MQTSVGDVDGDEAAASGGVAMSAKGDAGCRRWITLSAPNVAQKSGYDVAVVGAGPAGLTAALLCVGTGLQTVLYGATLEGGVRHDARTTALMQGAVRLLEHLGVWTSLLPDCAPLQRLRLIDDTDWSIKAPSVSFDADELGDEPFGWNIPNDALLTGLSDLCRETEALTLISEDVDAVTPGADSVSLQDAGGATTTARLVIAADGRNSLCRDAAGIDVSEWSYPQTAVACAFSHSLAHDDTSVEFHKAAGPLTLVPLPGDRSSLVWVTEPEQAAELAELSAADFEARLTEETHQVLGTVFDATPRGAFPIKGLTARSFARDRVVLVGEAAHVLPPIGAQGLNLGLRDAALISELAGQASAAGDDIAAPAVLNEYDRRRRLDVLPRTALVDFLNRSLFSGMMPLQGLRGLGLFLLDTVGPLRRAVMRQGIEPQTNLPQVMQRSNA